MWPFSRNTIGDELRRRGVSQLLHSTHLYRNLPQIIADRTLHTARSLKELHGGDASRYLHDPYRYERFAVGLDYINASLSYPNVELLYRRSKSEWTADWVHFELELALLSRADTLFCAVSAATELGRHLKAGEQGLRAMFADPVEHYRRSALPHHVPTHPQAEVLIRGALPLNLVRRIVVPNENIAAEVTRMCESRVLPMKVEIMPQLFVWPKWLVKS